MTITIGSFSANALTAQPFGYEGDARTGLTARTFRINGLLTSSQWQALISEYNTWRGTRITDADTLSSASVGTTVSLSITSANGLSVSSLACWFTEPPSGEQAGAYVSASATLVDAAQALAVLLREQEKSRQGTEATVPSLGTITLTRASGTSPVVTLTKPMLTRQDGPSVALTATGVSYVTGALTAHKVRQIEGYLTTGSYDDVLSWYDETIAAVPASSSWFPISPPSASAEVIINGGAKSTRYTVSLTALQII
ncbi:MAG: hypothetical protein EBV32_00395 [Proteobacteria bacterium]|uniref:Uncharacterized protein n=1 Tax=Candidatus Fonsibacter lacus TaxID=2576439 RepID=A0A964XQ33_9PROT|nr:hypothetical protein [Candidatus Fonsibacter lacus]NCU71656.1 hypothetical protein [Candidatus Fonsibacter lacus]